MHTKTCPRCGQQLFDDMPVCYECLYEFSKQEEVVPIRAYESYEGIAPSSGAMGPRLRICTASVDLVVPIPEDGLVVGRGSACDIVLHTPSVSRRHVRLEPREGGVLVTNLGARNPPSVDGNALLETALMTSEDVLSICGSSFSIA